MTHLQGSFIALVVFFASSLLAAATLTVPDDFPSIQSAVDAGAAGDIIQVRPGTYTEIITFAAPAKDVTLRSMGGPGVTTIQCPTGVRDRAVITILAGHTSAAVIEGFSIRGGSRQSGGPYNPQGAQGGGIEIRDSSPTVRGNRIFENWAYQGGAGVYLHQSNSLIEKNRIFNNSGGRGIGIRCYASSPSSTYAPVICNNPIYGNFYQGGFDRLVFRGHLLPLMRDRGMYFFLNASRVRLLDFKNFKVWPRFPAFLHSCFPQDAHWSNRPPFEPFALHATILESSRSGTLAGVGREGIFSVPGHPR